jgi:glycosyltransferase involved in cell wall biosynthesis
VQSKISILIPVYNGEKFLRETLGSVNEVVSPQGFELEIVVVNDGSTDSTTKIVHEFKRTSSHNLRLISQENKGESAAVNFGLANCNGDYLIILSHDDLLNPTILLESIPRLEANPNLVALYPDWNMIDSSGSIVALGQTDEFSDEVQYGMLGNIPGPGTTIRLNDEMKRRGIRNENFGFYSDLEQWMRLALVGEIARLPMFLASWRRHNSNQSATTKSQRMAREMLNLAYQFEGWANPRIRHLELSAKYSAHAKVAILGLSHKLPLKFDGRLHLLAALACRLGIALRGEKFHGVRLGIKELTLILSNPLGRKLLKFQQSNLVG